MDQDVPAGINDEVRRGCYIESKVRSNSKPVRFNKDGVLPKEAYEGEREYGVP